MISARAVGVSLLLAGLAVSAPLLELRGQPATSTLATTTTAASSTVPATSSAVTQTSTGISLVAPNPISIPVVTGHGSVKVFYTTKSAKETVRIVSTGIIPLADVSVSQPIDDGPGLRSITISMATSTLLDADKAYPGVLEFSVGKEVLSPIGFTITEATTAFTLQSQQFDICLLCGDPQSIRLELTNSGHAPIAELKVMALDLSDPAVHRRIVQDSRAAVEMTAHDHDTITIAPGQHAVVGIQPGQTRSILVPIARPKYAGAYAGILRVVANDRTSATASLTVHTRGPNGFPGSLVLFILAVAIGALLSYLLELWFGGGGGVARARATLRLEAARDRLEAVDLWRASWEKTHGDHLPATAARLNHNLAAVNSVLGGRNDTTPADLETAASSLELNAGLREALQTDVDFITQRLRLDPVKLVEAVVELDGSVPGTDLAAYETALTQIVNKYLVAAGGPAKFAVALAAGVQHRHPAPPLSPALHGYIDIALVIRTIVIGLVILLTAYTTQYLKTCNYGSSLDYIGTFLWSLGLTNAGSTLIAGIKKP